MLRKILLIFGFLVVVAGAGAGIYFAFFRSASAPKETETPTAGESGKLPQAGKREPTGETEAQEDGRLTLASPIATGGITQIKNLASGELAGVSASKDGGGLNYYDKTSGKFYRLTSDGDKEELSSRVFFNVSNVSWAHGKDKAVLEYPDGSNIVYDFESNTQATLPRHWEKFNFSPTGNQVSGLSIGIDPGNRWLFTANTDGTGARVVEPVGENADKVQVTWSPNDQVIAFSRTGDAKGFGREQIILIGKNHENFKGLLVEGLNFEGTWSPDGAKVLYSVSSVDSLMRPALWIVNGQGEAIGTNRKNLGLNTWVDKCAFSDASTVYCAVPQSLPEGAGLERGIANGIPDQFYKIDLVSGTKTFLAIPETQVNAINLRISSDGATLFFQDAISNSIFKLRLK